MDKPARFKVIIVGGGISGLTLANALDQTPHEIDWILLEAGREIAPPVGAGLALLPNGCRILDQLGVYADLAAQYEEVTSSGVYDSQGRPLISGRTDVARLVGARMSYPLGWVERRAVIQALYGRLRRKDRVVTNARVRAVEILDTDGMRVHCTNGTSHSGHLVVGADGVKSTIRQEMWRLSLERVLTEDINIPDELNSLTAEYQCLFGISKPPAALPVGTTEDTIAQDVSATVSVSKDGRAFWFLFARMPQKYAFKEAPKFSSTDAERFASRHGDLLVCPDAHITIADLVTHREMMVLVPLEEGVFKTWTANRITCLGDAVHKMTPHTGTGGMMAIEAAAALANTLVSLSARDPNPQLAELTRELHLWESRLKSRATVLVELGGNAARIQALNGWPHRMFVKYGLRHVGDARADEICDASVGAERIQYLPLPLRSIDGNMPFNPEYGIARHESKIKRFLTALCVFLFGLVACSSLGQSDERLSSRSSPPLNTMRLLIEKDGWQHELQQVSFLADYGVWYLIMIIEFCRRSHTLNAVRWSILWSALTLWGPSYFVPLYCGIHYAFSPLEAFAASDHRLTTLVYAKTLLPTAIMACVAYIWIACTLPASDWDCIGFTLRFHILHRVVARCLPEGTPREDRLVSAHKDLPYLCFTVISASALSLYTHICMLGGLEGIMARSTAESMSLGLNHHLIEMNSERGVFNISVTVWSCLLMWDLKVGGMVTRSWLVILFLGLVCMLLGGAGTLLGVMWLYREVALCWSGHKSAVVRSTPTG